MRQPAPQDREDKGAEQRGGRSREIRRHPLRRRQIRQRRTEEYADACGSTLRRAPVGTDLVRYCPDIHACGVVGLLGHRQRQEIVGEVVGNNLEQKLGR